MFGGIVRGTIKVVDGVLVSLLKKLQFCRLTTLYGRVLEIEEHVEHESNNNVINMSG
jgi:hypothetical protein